MDADWRTRITEIQPGAQLGAPAPEEEIREAERAVGGLFPADLRALLSQSSGVLDEWGHGPIQPLLRLVEATQFWRSLDLAAEFDNPDLSLAGFVVLGTDAGGGPFGFTLSPEPAVRIRYLDGEAGQFGAETYTLAEYLSYYFQSLSSFSD